MGMMRLRKCTVYSKACLFSALLRCFCNCLLAYHLYSLASQLQKPPCTAKKILRLQFAYIKKKRDSDTIFEFDFGMDIDEYCLYRGRRKSDKGKQ